MTVTILEVKDFLSKIEKRYIIVRTIEKTTSIVSEK